jgi:hypothetical protein
MVKDLKFQICDLRFEIDPSAFILALCGEFSFAPGIDSEGA